MLQERIEGKWLASFRRVLALNGIGPGTSAIIIAETQSRPVLVHLAELACYDLGADFSIITLPTPKLDAPVPVRSTGACKAIRGMRHVIEALKAVEIVVDVTVEGLLHAPEWQEIEDAGTRLFVICNEHPEILERTEPTIELAAKVELGIAALKQAKTMRVTSRAGTDLTIDVSGAPCGGTPGFTTRPGGVAHWPGGLCLCFPGKNTINGRIVMDAGDQNLTFKTFLRDRVILEVRNDYVTEIIGDNLDAELTREYLAAWNDPVAYGFSHVGWGVNTGAKWVSMALYDKRDMQATEFRAFAGSFLFSTGANQYAGRFTEGHFDFPLRNCTITLDDEVVARDGILQGRFA
ncbi:peptidase M29 [Rhizobium sp. KVB221]|uniref:Peptidase M29 n=1 Tax=Rhizobium setariae TaxID=2801340 RepID=A0A937CNP9_9HYPH|nr:peptidase M29 [Rhizobium setariae]MBL0371453.1 peptidase M29 [Rhizobium setariae]